jgi:teichuronic acid biosynthesis glycosyltransferase TuaC
MAPLRVLTVSHLYPSPGNDEYLFVHEQAQALRRLGVEIQVVSPTPWVPPGMRGSERNRRRLAKPGRATVDGIAVEYPRALVLPRRVLFDRLGDSYYLSVRSRLPDWRRAGIDLVHAHQALPDGAAAQRIARALGVPYVVAVHGADVYQSLRGPESERRKCAAVLGGAAAVVGVSSAVTRLLAPYVAADRLHVDLNGTVGGGRPAEPEDFLPGRPCVLTVAYLIERKAHAVVLEALARLRRVGRRIEYVVIGDGPLDAALRGQAARLGIADTVHLLGRRPNPEVQRFMARADLFALPSWDEAFGLVYAEAMMQGTPVLACRDEGCADFIEDGRSGYLVPPREVEAVADVIARVLDDPDEARKVGEAGRVAAAGLTWQANAERQLAIYHRALGRPVTPSASVKATSGAGHDPRETA